MKLMFWKKDAGDAAENAQETSETPPGLAAKIRVRLLAFLQRFTKKSTFRAEEDQIPETASRPEKRSAVAEADLEPSDMPPPAGFLSRIKQGVTALLSKYKSPEGKYDFKPKFTLKRLLVAGAGCLLIGMTFIVWKILTPPEIHAGTSHGLTETLTPEKNTETPPLKVEPAPEISHTEVAPPKIEHAPEKNPTELDAHKIAEPPKNENPELEALKKQNAELQAKIESLKDKPSQPYFPPSRQSEGKNTSPSGGAEMTIGNSDPKNTAMTLKEAIEAMNASTGDYKKKSAK